MFTPGLVVGASWNQSSRIFLPPMVPGRKKGVGHPSILGSSPPRTLPLERMSSRSALPHPRETQPVEHAFFPKTDARAPNACSKSPVFFFFRRRWTRTGSSLDAALDYHVGPHDRSPGPADSTGSCPSITAPLTSRLSYLRNVCERGLVPER